MKRYLVAAFIMIIPLYGIRKASEELLQGITLKKARTLASPAGRMTVASNSLVPETQLAKSPE